MLEKEDCSTRGVAFVANMKGWTRHNFSLDYCRDFMNMLEGNVVPAKVELFLIVDPPVWLLHYSQHALGGIRPEGQISFVT